MANYCDKSETPENSGVSSSVPGTGIEPNHRRPSLRRNRRHTRPGVSSVPLHCYMISRLEGPPDWDSRCGGS